MEPRQQPREAADDTSTRASSAHGYPPEAPTRAEQQYAAGNQQQSDAGGQAGASGQTARSGQGAAGQGVTGQGITGQADARTHRLRALSSTVAAGSSTAARTTVRGIRKLTQAQGMGETGLYKLIEVHAFHMGGDAAMAVGLAGTLFFAATTSEARSQVGLALLITMAPFAIVAPLIGPALDKVRRGRRWAIGSTMATRAFLCWVLAGIITDDGNYWLYPAALGCLVASKAYNVTRAAAVPRLLPEPVTLVGANSRISLAGTVGTGVAGALAGGASYFGPEWALRVAFLVFLAGTILAILLPARVDSPEGEQSPSEAGARQGTAASAGKPSRGVPRLVVVGMRSNAAIRAFSGFLMLFLAFLLRQEPLPGWKPALLLSLVAGAYGAGAGIGTALGALARTRRPDIMVRILLLLAAVTSVAAAVFYGLVTIAIAAFVAGVAHQLGKLGLDALIQSEVPEHVRTGVFARSETLLQLAWVVGGGIGIALPLIPQLGLGVSSAWLIGTLILVLRTRGRPRGAARPTRTPRSAAAPTAQTPAAGNPPAAPTAAPKPATGPPNTTWEDPTMARPGAGRAEPAHHPGGSSASRGDPQDGDGRGAQTATPDEPSAYADRHTQAVCPGPGLPTNVPGAPPPPGQPFPRHGDSEHGGTLPGRARLPEHYPRPEHTAPSPSAPASHPPPGPAAPPREQPPQRQQHNQQDHAAPEQALPPSTLHARSTTADQPLPAAGSPPAGHTPGSAQPHTPSDRRPRPDPPPHPMAPRGTGFTSPTQADPPEADDPERPQ